MGGTFPLRENSWGLNLKLSFPIGGSTSNSNTNTGLRSNSLAGTGIRNDNTNFNSASNSNLQLFDNLSYGRKIMESKIKLGESITEHQRINLAVGAEVENVLNTLRENWNAVQLGSGKTLNRIENFRIVSARFAAGDAKRADILSAETELADSETSLIDSVVSYISTASELERVSGMSPNALKLYEKSVGKGISTLNNLIVDKSEKKFFGSLPERETGRSLIEEFNSKEPEEPVKNFIDEIKEDEL